MNTKLWHETNTREMLFLPDINHLVVSISKNATKLNPEKVARIANIPRSTDIRSENPS